MTKPSVSDSAARRRPNVRASSSDSDPLHSRVKADKSNPTNPRKLGARIADLESQLGLAQEDLKCLKNQFSTAKNDQLDNKFKQKVLSLQMAEDAAGVVDHEETHVFEVSIDKELEPQNPLFHDLDLKNDEIKLLKASVRVKDRELELVLGENESLKREVNEKLHKLSSAESEVRELTSRLNKVVQELEESKLNADQMRAELHDVEKGKAGLEDEMTKLRVQTEQWRKAADAAASVLAAGGMGSHMRGGRISERCGSMDTMSLFERVSLHDDPDYAFATEKRKGIKMLGELWRKKGQK